MHMEINKHHIINITETAPVITNLETIPTLAELFLTTLPIISETTPGITLESIFDTSLDSIGYKNTMV